MSCIKRLDADFERACSLPLARDTAYIIFSDCHRGVGNGNDNFLKNEPLYLAAMQHYLKEGFSYIELGDGDELWENRSIADIKEMHSHSFYLLEQFERRGRMYGVYGNHDMVKKYRRFVWKYREAYDCPHTLGQRPCCPGLGFYPGIILQDEETGQEIYLTHGHQADLLNSAWWPLARFLVRYVWKFLEQLGIPDPTSAAKNYTKKDHSEKKLSAWAEKKGRILITGHTHRPSVGNGRTPYFNTGSCVHPGGITGIEIQNRCITLVKWSIKAREDGTLYADRDILGAPVFLDALWE